MTTGVRYKFNGSTLGVQTGYVGASPQQPISAITAADPAIITYSGTRIVDGDVGRISGVVGMTEVNGDVYVADNTSATNADLAGYDSSANTPYISGGIWEEASFSNFCELTGVNQQDGTSDEIDATTICSTAKEFEVGLSDSGTLQLDYNYAPNEAVQTAMRAAKESGDTIAVKIVFPNGGGTVIMLGSVQQQSFQGQVSGLWTGSATLKLTGPIFVL